MEDEGISVENDDDGSSDSGYHMIDSNFPRGATEKRASMVEIVGKGYTDENETRAKVGPVVRRSRDRRKPSRGKLPDRSYPGRHVSA